jgi:hypothetical protein
MPRCTVCAITRSLTCAASRLVCCVATCGKHWCTGCGRLLSADDRLKQCTACRMQPSPKSAVLDTAACITRNISELMRALPTHSHHRAPLVHYLSLDLDSTTAAALHCSASYVRQCKRKDYSGSDLLQDRYARDVKRQKTQPGVLQALCDFLAASCPTKSGERSVTFHQYVSDDALYQAYSTSCFPAVSFHTFYDIKKWMRVRHAGKHFGQFDCAKCLRRQQLPPLITAEADADRRRAMQEELQRCDRHEQLKSCNAISTISSAPPSARASCCY